MAKKKTSSKKKTPEPVVNNTSLTEVSKFLKKYKKGELDHIVEFSQDLIDKPRPSVPVGNVKFEYLLGGAFNEQLENRCGGFPRAAITQVYGAEHCGKTSVCLHAAAQATALGGTVLYVDYEHILDMRYARYLGVPVENEQRFMLVQPNTLEQGVATALVAIKMGVDLVIFDSVGAALPANKDTSEANVASGKVSALGLQARAWGDLLPVLQQRLSEFQNTALVAISQTRSNIQGYKPSVQGGRGWRFYSAVRMNMRPIGTVQATQYDAATNSSQKTKVATNVKVTIDKNKISGTQHWEAVIDVMPWRGFDPLTSAVDVLLAHKVVVQAGAWFSYTRKNGDEIRGQGMANFMVSLREAPGVLEEMNVLARGCLKDQQEIGPPMEEELSDDILEGIQT